MKIIKADSKKYISPIEIDQIITHPKNHVWVDKTHCGNGGTTAMRDWACEKHKNLALILPNQQVAFLKAQEWADDDSVKANIRLVYGGSPLEERIENTSYPNITLFVINSFFETKPSASDFDVIMVDEAHKMIVDSEYRALMNVFEGRMDRFYGNVKVVYISGTPIIFNGDWDIKIETKNPMLKYPKTKIYDKSSLHYDAVKDCEAGENVLIFLPTYSKMMSFLESLRSEILKDVSVLVGGRILNKDFSREKMTSSLMSEKHDPNKRIQVVSKSGLEGWDFKKNDVKVYMAWDQSKGVEALTRAEITQFIGRVRGSVESVTICKSGKMELGSASWSVKKALGRESKMDKAIERSLIFKRFLADERISDVDKTFMKERQKYLDYDTRGLSRFRRQYKNDLYSTHLQLIRFREQRELHFSNVISPREADQQSWVTNQRMLPPNPVENFASYGNVDFFEYSEVEQWIIPIDADEEFFEKRRTFSQNMKFYHPCDNLGEIFNSRNWSKDDMLNSRGSRKILDIQASLKALLEFIQPFKDDLEERFTKIQQDYIGLTNLIEIHEQALKNRQYIQGDIITNLTKLITKAQRTLKKTSISTNERLEINDELKILLDRREKLKIDYPKTVLKAILCLLDLREGQRVTRGYRDYNVLTVIGGKVANRIKDLINEVIKSGWVKSSDLEQVAWKSCLIVGQVSFNEYGDVYQLGGEMARAEYKIKVNSLAINLRVN